MRGPFHQAVKLARLLLVLALLLHAIPTVQAMRCPTRGPPLDSHPSQLNEATPGPALASSDVVWVLYSDGRIGLFVGNNPISRIDPLGLAPEIVIDQRVMKPEAQYVTVQSAMGMAEMLQDADYTLRTIGNWIGDNITGDQRLGDSLLDFLVGSPEGLAGTTGKVLGKLATVLKSKPCPGKTPTQLSVDDKLARYLLNPTHPKGGSKAAWFEQALGFNAANAEDLASQLVFDPSKAVQTEVTQYGTKFNQTIDVTGANGRTIPVVTAWIRGNDGVVRLVTAVPAN
jgi:hypothetical protein